MIYEMDSCASSYWQATFFTLAYNLADQWQMSTNTSVRCPQSPKKFTIEAIFVMCVIFFFVVLSLIGSSINAYEFLLEAVARKKTSRNLKDKKNNANKETQVTKGIKTNESSTISACTGNWRTFFDCFSVQANAIKLLGADSEQEYLRFLDGIRAIIFLLVFFIHFLYLCILSIKNVDKHIKIAHQIPSIKFLHQLGTNSGFLISAFIVLSGFLNGYLFSKYFKKNNGKIPWVAFYGFRFLRLTPVYMVLLGFYATLLTYMSSSPIWPTYDTNPMCKKTWIWNLLYISNFNSCNKQCMIMTWFLSCLMQLYVISPIFMIPLNRWPIIGYILSLLAICISCFSSFIITKQHKMLSAIPKVVPEFEELHTQLWLIIDHLHQNTLVRLTPYLIGILLGNYLHSRKLSKNNLLTLTFGWILSAILICVSFFALYGREENAWESAVFNGVKDLLFSCSFSWLIFVCATGQGGFISKFLSHRIFTPISRLSFCGYLTQSIVLEGYFLSTEVVVDGSILYQIIPSDFSWVLLLARLLLWTLLSAFVASLLFESPIIRLLHICFSETKKRQ